ncbi:heme o synthase [Vreelandella sulfidaeris]
MRNITMTLPTARSSLTWSWKELLGLCKIKVVAVMLVCTAVGMALATPGLPPLANVVMGLLGIGLASCGAAAFNHVIDRHLDAVMTRTSRRPVASKRLPVVVALGWATLLSIAGVVLLAWQVNPLTAALTFASLIGYALIYTAFLKRATPQNIVIGGLAGAAPPLLGWVAVTGQISPEPLLLMLIIFAWTPPHFWALAIHKCDDYSRAGIPMLPVTHGVPFTRLQIWLYGWLTVLATLLPIMIGMSGALYFLVVLCLNARFMVWNWRVWRGLDSTAPIGAFWFSIRYLLGVFGALLLDHYATSLSW